MNEKDLFHSKLEAYVRKGGDIILDNDGNNSNDCLDVFLEKFPEWKDCDLAPTLFNHSDESCKARPLVLSHEGSVQQHLLFDFVGKRHLLQPVPPHRYHRGRSLWMLYALNINRLMRMQFTDQEIFENIYQNQGGWVARTLERLLKPFNSDKGDEHIVEKVRFGAAGSVEAVCQMISNHLQTLGALVVENFQVFPEFVDGDNLVFQGNWERKDKFDETKINVKHALLVVGARHTGSSDDMGGLALLMQNAWSKKPFVVVGYDMLTSMGINYFYAVKVSSFLQRSAMYWEVSPRPVQSGSPAHQKNQEFSWVLAKKSGHTPERTAQGGMPSYLLGVC